LESRLGDRLALLTGGAGDWPERQQTLRATLDWSFELLGEETKRLFARLAPFAGGFVLQSAESICDADLDTIGALVDNSLLQVERDRFSMLETVCAYARERLAESGEHDEVRRRHAAYFVDLAERTALDLVRQKQAAALELLDAEHSNL